MINVAKRFFGITLFLYEEYTENPISPKAEAEYQKLLHSLLNASFSSAPLVISLYIALSFIAAFSMFPCERLVCVHMCAHVYVCAFSLSLTSTIL